MFVTCKLGMLENSPQDSIWGQ